jgi:hypothetical protein
MHAHVYLWIDRRVASILGPGSTLWPSLGRTIIRRRANYIGEGKAPSDDVFPGAVAAAIAELQALLLTGPGTAKASWSHIAGPPPGPGSGASRMNHPTDPEFVLAARKSCRATAHRCG